MAFIDKNNNNIIGISDFHYALLTENTISAYTHAEMTPIVGLAQVGVSPVLAEGSFYGDNSRLLYEKSITGFDLTVELGSIPEAVKAEWFGNDYNETTGKVIIKSSDISGELAIAFKAVKADGQFTYFKFLASKAQLGDSSIATKGSDITFQSETITFNCIARITDGALYEKQLAGTDGAEGADFFNAVV